MNPQQILAAMQDSDGIDKAEPIAKVMIRDHWFALSASIQAKNPVAIKYATYEAVRVMRMWVGEYADDSVLAGLVADLRGQYSPADAPPPPAPKQTPVRSRSEALPQSERFAAMARAQHVARQSPYDAHDLYREWQIGIDEGGNETIDEVCSRVLRSHPDFAESWLA